MSVISYSIRNPLIINLSLAVVVVMGVLSWYGLPQEMFPLVELDKVRIITVFEGAPPEEVERQVTLPIEEEFDGMADIDVITSTSLEGASQVLIELKPGSDVDNFMRDARTALDQVTDLPDSAEQPELKRLQTRFPVISLAVYGEVSRAYLYEVAEKVRRRMQQIPGIASVGMAGEREWELWVIVDPHELAARQVSLDLLVRALRDNLSDQPGGSIEAQEGDILLRGKGYEPEPEAMREIVLRSNANQGLLKLGEVAHIERRFEEARTFGRFNGQPSVNLTVSKTLQSSSIEIAAQVRALAEELKGELPQTVQVGVFGDLSVYVKNRLDTVKSSGLVGLVLLLISLYLFLNFRVALVTAMGIPISFLIAIVLLYFLDYTINMVSLFAFLIALGMIVDDAIIVTENVYRHMANGVPPSEAAEQASREVFWPVVASTATTIAAFLPMFAIGGTLGVFIAVIPVVVTFALLGSLWEAFLILPSHAAHFLRVTPAVAERPDRWARFLHGYGEWLRWSSRHKYLIAVISIGILAISLVYAATRIPYQQFGEVDTGQFFVNIEAPNTYGLDETLGLAKQLEASILRQVKPHELDTMLTNVGVSFIDFNRVKFGSNVIQFVIDLKKQVAKSFIEKWITPLVSLKFERQGSRLRDADIIINELRSDLQRLAGVNKLSILRPQGGPAGADIEIGVIGPEIPVLQAQVNRIQDYLSRMPGVKDVQHDMEPGKLEYQYQLNQRGRLLGISQSSLADVVRTGFLGNELMHVSWKDKRLPVRLIYTDAIRQRSDSLQQLPIVLANGNTVYLGEVADISISRGLNSIQRRGAQRMATLTAEVDTETITALQVTARVQQEFQQLEKQLPGYQLLFLGEKKAASDAMQGMLVAMVIALVLIFFILATLFNSLLDPLIVMFIIPFGLVGVIVGHAVFGYNLQFLSMVGFIALAGIIVNDSLILVDFIRRQRRQGLGPIDSVVEAGKVRARPIILTSVTTFLGISPLIFFATGQTAFLSPMAVSLGFGLIFATVLILIALPCFYLIADDFRGLFRTRTRASLDAQATARTIPQD